MKYQTPLTTRLACGIACLGLAACLILPWTVGCDRTSVADGIEDQPATVSHVLEVKVRPITLGKAEMTLDLIGSMAPA